MNIALAALAAAGVMLLVAGAPRIRLAVRVGDYLRPAPSTDVSADSPSPARADPMWGRRAVAAACGGVVGLLLAQGDLFVAGPSRSAPALAVLGAATGVLLLNMHRSTQRQRRGRRLRYELPIVAEALALHVMAGESVATAIRRFTIEGTGVAAEELAEVMTEVDGGGGLAEALLAVGRRTAEPEASRLYGALAHAHVTGGRLGATLSELAVDYRAALTREVTAEGGRRSLATYGPILGLMVPVTLLFLLYPTIDGLRRLAP